ncbi:MAG: glycosyltransferase [Saprospiraceae bacterium]|nr:glycosyltransferase [Saprospiraceae bacterium]
MNYTVARALYKNQMLSCLYTDICADKQPIKFISWLFSLLGVESAKRLMQRRSKIPTSMVTHFPRLGWEYFARKNKAIYTQAEEFGNYLWAEEEFSKRILDVWKKDVCTHLYLYNTAAYNIIQENKVSKIVLEQCSLPIRYYLNRISDEESQYPDWTLTKTSEIINDELFIKYAEQERKELQQADCVVAPSQAVLDAIKEEGIQLKDFRLIPYGYTFAKTETPRKLQQRLKIATIGALELRKGIHHFYNLSGKGINAEFVAIGGLGSNLPEEKIELLKKSIRLTGHLNRKDLLREFSSVDVLLFLTIGEGSATVVYEALSLGIPVITTKEAGSIIEHEVSGFIVRANDYDTIISYLQRLSDPDEYARMSEAALHRSQYGSAKAYEERLILNLPTI